MKHFLRLVRPVNLIVIALTMYAVRVFIILSSGKFGGLTITREGVNFFLLVVSTVLIAAGGNIINDYFDVKADRINKPHKLIIGKFIKPRWAIVTHWTFNFIAFAIACYLSWNYQTFWYVFVHLISINALWFYSTYFKRKFLIGNLIIAGLTALVPILCGIHFYIQVHEVKGQFEFADSSVTDVWLHRLYDRGLFIYVLAVFAFALNFVREIIKDMQDVQGDLMLKAKTLPIVLGIERTRWTALILLVLILITGTFFVLQWEGGEVFFTAIIPVYFTAGFCLLGVYFLLHSIERKSLKRADLSLKLAMVIGCCLPYYWYFLL